MKQGNGLLILLVTYLQLLTLHIKNNETTIWKWIEERGGERGRESERETEKEREGGKK